MSGNFETFRNSMEVENDDDDNPCYVTQDSYSTLTNIDYFTCSWHRLPSRLFAFLNGMLTGVSRDIFCRLGNEEVRSPIIFRENRYIINYCVCGCLVLRKKKIRKTCYFHACNIMLLLCFLLSRQDDAGRAETCWPNG